MNPPSEGVEKQAYWRGFHGQSSTWLHDTDAHRAWMRGKADRDRQTSVADLAAGVLDELQGKPVNHLKTRRSNGR